MDFLFSTGAFIQIIIGLGVLIFVHEFGHFAMAKWVGINVAQFSIGFGRAVVAYRKGIGFTNGKTEKEYNRRVSEYLADRAMAKDGEGKEEQNNGEGEGEGNDSDKSKVEGVESSGELDATPGEIEEANTALGLGETEYRFNWMPLGGYVKMVGQDDMDPTNISKNPRAFNNKPIWARLCVVSAGVIMNVIFGAVFFMVAFMIGVKFPPAEVGAVLAGSPAATTAAEGHPEIVGLRAGDVITSIGGEKPIDFMDLFVASVLAGPEEIVELEVERRDIGGIGDIGGDDGVEAARLIFRLKPVVNPDSGMLSVGISPPISLELLPKMSELSDVFERAGVEPGWKLTAVDGEAVSAFWQYDKILSRASGN